MNLRPAALRSALLSLFTRREPRQLLRLNVQRCVALVMALLLLPLAQIDALAQQQDPQKPSPYQYGQPNTYAPPNPDYSQQQPAYPQQPGSDYGYQAQPYSQQQYPQQAPGQQRFPSQPGNQDYAGQPSYPDQPGAGQPPDLNQQLNQQPDQGFASQQLEQLVAPIALYPDALVAQILAAATYPAQVVAADHWLQSLGRVSPDQVAAAANAQSTWDPSVKALTAFPQVLSMLDQDLQWTTDLGNAYYNQPQDVLSTIQVLRQRAQNAGTLQNTPQEQVSNDQGYIQLAPTNPEEVYVPSYSPWYAFGAPINPYPGFAYFGAIGAGLRFGAGIALGAFLHWPFGWLGWGLNWHGSSIFFNHAPYYSRSTSVAHWGGFHGGYGGGYRSSYGSNFAGGRSMPSRPSRPMPQGRQSAGNFRGESAYGRPSNGIESQRYAESQRTARDDAGSSYRGPESGGTSYRGNENYGSARAQAFAGNRPENYAYAHPAEPLNRGYASGYSGSYGRESSPYAGTRPAEPLRQQYAAPQQQFSRPQSYTNPGYNSGAYRGPQSFTNQRSYAATSPASRSFQQSAPRYESSGGSHFFAGGHSESFHAPKAPSYHAPKMSGGGHSGGGHGHDNGGKHR